MKQMPTISFPDLSNRTADAEIARRGVEALDYDALDMRLFSLIDVSEAGHRIRISPETQGIRNEATGMFAARAMMLARRNTAAAALMQDGKAGLVGVYRTRSAAIAAAAALFASMEG